MGLAISDLTQLWDQYRERHSRDSTTITEHYTIAWSDRAEMKDLLLNIAHSDYSGAYCREVGIEKFGDPDTSGGGPKTARLTVQWKTETSRDREGSGGGAGKSDISSWLEHWETGGEAITIGEGYRWSDDATFDDCTPVLKTSVSAVKMFPSATITYTGRSSDVDADAKFKILGIVGTINNGNWEIKDFTFSDGHLLFVGADFDENKDADGSDFHNIVYKFMYHHSDSWNFFWNPKAEGGPKWEKLIDEDGNSPYAKADFDDLEPTNW